jgi:hypothetical protein
MGYCGRSEERENIMVMIRLTEEDLVRLTAIQVDHDAQEALAFIRERILPEIQRQQNSRMKGPLDGGTGSIR